MGTWVEVGRRLAFISIKNRTPTAPLPWGFPGAVEEMKAVGIAGPAGSVDGVQTQNLPKLNVNFFVI